MFAYRIRLMPVLVLMLLFGGTSAHCATQDFTDVQIQTVKVTENVFMLAGDGGGGNIGISTGTDGVFMIDASYAPLSDKIKAAIATVSDKPIRFLVTTHWHQDHTGGNQSIAGTGAVLAAHENVRKRLSTEQYIEFLKKTIPPLPQSALPVITFNRDMTFHLNGDEIHVFHLGRVHTDGDAIVQFKKANVIHMGDIYFNGMYPFIDVSVGGSINGMIKAVQRILILCNENTKIIPGHGPLSDRAGLEKYLTMMVSVRDQIAREIKAGKTLEQVIASQPTGDYDPVWGKGFLKPEQFVTIVYGSLMKGK